MPAESEAQRRAAGAALSAKRKGSPSNLKGASKDMYEDMSEDDLEDFASKSNEDSLIKSIDDYIEKWGEGGYEDYGGYYYSPPPTPPAPAAPQPTATVTNSSPSDPPGASYTAPVSQSNASPPSVNTGGDPYPVSTSSSSSTSSVDPAPEASYDSGGENNNPSSSTSTSVSSETSTSSNPSYSSSDASNYSWDVDPGIEPVSTASSGANIPTGGQEINDGSSYSSGASSAGVSTGSADPVDTGEIGEWDNYAEGVAQGTSNSNFTSPTGAADTTNDSNPLSGTTGSFGIEPNDYNSGTNQTVVPSGPGTTGNEGQTSTTAAFDPNVDNDSDQAVDAVTTREGDSRMGMDEGWDDVNNPNFGGDWQNQPINTGGDGDNNLVKPSDPTSYMGDPTYPGGEPVVPPGTPPGGGGGGDNNKGGGGGGGKDDGQDDDGSKWWDFIPGAAGWITDKVGSGWEDIGEAEWIKWAQSVGPDVYDHVTSGFASYEHPTTGQKASNIGMGVGTESQSAQESRNKNVSSSGLLDAADSFGGSSFDSSTSSSITTAAGSQEGDDYSYYLANSEKTSDDAENVSIREISRYLERYG